MNVISYFSRHKTEKKNSHFHKHTNSHLHSDESGCKWAKRHVLETGPLAALRHQQASPRGISRSIKPVNQMLCGISVKVRRGTVRWPRSVETKCKNAEIILDFAFVLWLLYLCCGLCIRVLAFAFVLWLVHSIWHFWATVEKQGKNNKTVWIYGGI